MAELVTCSMFGILSRIGTHAAGVEGHATEVVWASKVEGQLRSKAAAQPHQLSPRVTALRVSVRVGCRYALAFDSGHLIVLTDGELSLDVPHKGEALADVQWDPLSDGYLLVGCRSGVMHMYDVDSRQQLQTFDRVPGGGAPAATHAPARDSFFSCRGCDPRSHTATAAAAAARAQVCRCSRGSPACPATSSPSPTRRASSGCGTSPIGRRRM